MEHYSFTEILNIGGVREHAFPLPYITLLGDEWAPVTGCSFNNDHWQLTETSDCCEFLLRLNMSISYLDVFQADILSNRVHLYALKLLIKCDPSVVQTKLYVKPSTQHGRDFQNVLLKVVKFVVYLNIPKFTQHLKTFGTIRGYDALLLVLRKTIDGMRPTFYSPMMSIDEQIMNEQLPACPEWTHLPLLPEQEQSVVWMKNFEAHILREENYVMIPTTVPLLDTQYYYSMEHHALVPPNARISFPDKKICYYGGILTDKLGTGKTAVALRLIVDSYTLAVQTQFDPIVHLSRIPTRCTLIVVPINLTKQWKCEIDKFLGSNFNYITVFNSREYDKLTLQHIMNCKLILISDNFLTGTHYTKKTKLVCGDGRPTPYLMSNYMKSQFKGDEVLLFQNFLWRRIIYDESHEQLISPRCNDKRTCILRELKAQNYWGLTGTPFLNDITTSNMIFQFTTDVASLYETSAIVQRCVHRSPHIERLQPVLVHEHFVDISERERDLLNAYNGSNLSQFIQLCTSFAVLATGEITDEQIVSMSFDKLAQTVIQKRKTDIAKLNKTLESLTSSKEIHSQTLQNLCSLHNIPLPSLEGVSESKEDSDPDDDVHDASVRNTLRQIKVTTRKIALLAADLRDMTAEKDFFEKQLSTTETCPICLCQDSNIFTLCGHWFCKDCVKTYLTTTHNGPCPMCKTKLKLSDWIETTQNEMITTPQKFGSKLLEIARVLRDIKQRGEKAILFCQWAELARSVKAILNDGGVKAVSITGNSSIRHSAINSMSTGDADVLILSLESSNSGLNLIDANHVIFAHAIVSPPEDTTQLRMTQAIGRVHRLGQTKQVYVHHFITKGTREETQYRANMQLN